VCLAVLSCNATPPPCSGTIPSQWGQLAELEVLRMRHNVLTGSLPAGAMAAAHTHTRMHKSVLKSQTFLKSSTDLSHDWRKAASKRSELSQFFTPLPSPPHSNTELVHWLALYEATRLAPAAG
jgi:hypothetical protein